ncbi:50S ribosomal subunit protein L3 [Erysipelotrichaceae bacterium]|nr:50S ribosomal subunit protein L3 [Erysipelotrichaceae bacterium]
MKGILGRKIGMTQVFTTTGELVPVTVIQIENNVVLQKKTIATDGYNAVQLGFEEKPERLANKSEKGHAGKAETTPKRYIREMRDFDIDVEVGAIVLPGDVFTEGEVVDVTGTSKGKGFQGAIKRHNQSRGPMAHGSRYHRRPGSMGAVAANRVFKGKKLPGHMGAKTITVQNLEIVKIDTENNVVLVRGNVPGSKKAIVTIKSNVKGRKDRDAKDLVNYTKTESVASTEE